MRWHPRGIPVNVSCSCMFAVVTIQAATAWYADELEREAKALTRHMTAGEGESNADAAVLSPLGKLGLRTPRKAGKTSPGSKVCPLSDTREDLPLFVLWYITCNACHMRCQLAYL